jgi:hypothetical protein
MNKVYTLEHKGYEFDDLDYGSFYIVCASLDKNKIIEKFNKEKEWYIKIINKEQSRTDKDDTYKEDYQIYRDESDYFEAWVGKWCYEYSINEYELI